MKKKAIRALDNHYLANWGESMFDEWWPDPDEYTWIFNRGAKTIKMVYDPKTNIVREYVTE